jgi:hypothetical protein
MGGRIVSSVNLGKSKRVRETKNNLTKYVKEKSTNIAINTALDLIAASDPALGVLIAAGRTIQWAAGAAEEIHSAYEKKGVEAAVVKGAEKTAEYGMQMVKHQAIESVVSAGWEGLKQQHNISSTSFTDTFVVSSVTNTIDEVFSSAK